MPIEKEILLQRSLNYPHVVRLLDVLEDSENVYMIQEYCGGGELFERVEPDVGFPSIVCHFYFAQLCELCSICMSEALLIEILNRRIGYWMRGVI